ncbi:Protein kinase superfamily protein [Abeliophyllum distichum]|uniref:Protein kinase superfamily protein n=1 Tax=Abeliophyllum distichum TaxID=126358 RepID=A0ABD1TJD9_9LAMI
MIQENTEFLARRLDMDELDLDTVENLGRLDPRSDLLKQKAEPVEELELIEVDLNRPEKVLRIRKELKLSDVKPKQQRRRPLNPERYEALAKEVEKLLKYGFIRESLYPRWVDNPVLVKKNNGAWRVCIDFTDLNKACPKDSFPLLWIDQMVEATAGHELLNFMDAYSGYNQIAMHEDDQEHTSFV